ncbi:thiamine phosphate synthase [Candidatus Omnitrophota bacterium]
MKSKKQQLKNWKLYAVLDNSLFPDRRKLLRKFYDLLESPVDAVQLRFKDFTEPALYRTARKMAVRAKEKNVPLIINDRPDIALFLGASGVHLGKGDIPASTARKMLGAGAIVGRTIRGLKDLEAVDTSAVDYVAIGPVYRTPLKPGLKTVPRRLLRELCSKASLPLVAIGGINKRNVRRLIAEGVRMVAFARYGITEKDTRKEIEELERIIKREIK